MSHLGKRLKLQALPSVTDVGARADSTTFEGDLHAADRAQIVHGFVVRSSRESVRAMGDIVRKKKGSKDYGWYIRWTENGKRREKASHQPTYALAKRMLIEIEARVARGEVGVSEPAKAQITVGELRDRYLAEYTSPRLKDRERWREGTHYMLRRVLPLIEHIPIRELTSRDVARARDAAAKKYAPGTVRSSMIPLASMCVWAMKQELLDKNPVVGVQRPRYASPRLDYLTAEEVRALLAETERRARIPKKDSVRLAWWSRWVAISLAVRLGLRKGELFGLRWQDIDLDAGRLTVARSYATTPKSGKPRHLRLPAPLLPLLREWQEICPPTPGRLVCPLWGRFTLRWEMANRTGNDHRLPELLHAAGCRVFSRPWHMLRHTFASHFAQSGGSVLALSQILGHSDVKVTMIYAHLSSDYLAAEVDRIKY